MATNYLPTFGEGLRQAQNRLPDIGAHRSRSHKAGSRYDDVFMDPESVGLKFGTTHPAATDHARDWYDPNPLTLRSEHYQEKFTVTFLAYYNLVRIVTGASAIIVIERNNGAPEALSDVDARVAHPEPVSDEVQTVVNFRRISVKYQQPFGEHFHGTPAEQAERMAIYREQVWSAYSLKLEMMSRLNLKDNVPTVDWQTRDRPHLQSINMTWWGICQRFTDKPAVDVIMAAVQQFVVQGYLRPNGLNNAVVVVPMLFHRAILDNVKPQTKLHNRNDLTERPYNETTRAVVGLTVDGKIIPKTITSFNALELPFSQGIKVVGYETILDPRLQDPWITNNASLPCAICFLPGTRELRVELPSHADRVFTSLDLLNGSGMYPDLGSRELAANMWTTAGRNQCRDRVGQDWPCRGNYGSGTVGCTPMYAHNLSAAAASRRVFEQYVNAVIGAGATNLDVFAQFVRQNTGLNATDTMQTIVADCGILARPGNTLPTTIVADTAVGTRDDFAYRIGLAVDPSRVFAVRHDIVNKSFHNRDIARHVYRHFPLVALCALFENENRKVAPAVPNFDTVWEVVMNPRYHDTEGAADIVAAFVESEHRWTEIFVDRGLGLLQADVSLPHEFLGVARHMLQSYGSNHGAAVLATLDRYAPMPQDMQLATLQRPRQVSTSRDFARSVSDYTTPLIKATMATLAGMYALTDATTTAGLTAAQEKQRCEAQAAMQTLQSLRMEHDELVSQLNENAAANVDVTDIRTAINELRERYDDAVDVVATKYVLRDSAAIAAHTPKLERFRSTDFCRRAMSSVAYRTEIKWELKPFGIAFLLASLPCSARVLEFLNRVYPYTAFGGAVLLFVTGTSCPIYVTSEEANTLYMSDTRYTEEAWRDYTDPRKIQLDVRYAFLTKKSNSMQIPNAHISAMTLKAGIAPPYRVGAQLNAQTCVSDLNVGATVIYGGYHGVNLQSYCQKNSITRIPPSHQNVRMGPHWQDVCDVEHVGHALVGDLWYKTESESGSSIHIDWKTVYMPMSGSIISGSGSGIDRVEQLDGLGQAKFAH